MKDLKSLIHFKFPFSQMILILESKMRKEDCILNNEITFDFIKNIK